MKRENSRSPASSQRSLTESVAAGFSLLLIQSVAAKLITIVGQLVLAWYLTPDDFGVMGMAYTVAGFVALLQQAGFREVLIQRQAKLRLWANAAFWMSLCLGIVSAILLVMLAPLAAHIYEWGFFLTAGHRTDGSRAAITPMLFVMAAAAPLTAMSVVPLAKLQCDMRFRELTFISLVQVLGSMSLSCAFAYAGLGPMSFVLPLPIVALICGLMAWRVASLPCKLRLDLRRWKFMVADNFLLLGAAFFFQITIQGGAAFLGLFHQENLVVGVYTFAFALSMQVTQLFTQQLGNALFPALSRLQADPSRQRDAFIRAARCLILLGMPVCILQAALTPQLLELLFSGKWQPAVIPTQILCVGMAMQLLNGPSMKYLLAMGKNRLLFVTSILCSIAFVSMVLPAAMFGGVILVSLAVAVYAAVVGLALLTIPLILTGGGGAWTEALSIYLVPLAISALATIAGVGISSYLVPHGREEISQILLITTLTLALYVPLVRYAAPKESQELAMLLRKLRARFSE